MERAANEGSDLVLLPESAVHNNTGLNKESVAEPVPDGPTCALFARAARENNMYVCVNLTERSDDGILFNTAVLFGRDGGVVRTYRKVHPYWPEEIWEGISPGEVAPVFDLDFGRVGIIICYDSWFPETTRLLGLKGAEVILFPSAGYHPPLLPARAVDSRVYIVASSLHHPAAILDTLGNSVASTESGLVTASVDLSRRPTPHANAGGSFNTSPGGRRGTRNSLSARLYDELGATIADWQSDGPLVLRQRERKRQLPREQPGTRRERRMIHLACEPLISPLSTTTSLGSGCLLRGLSNQNVGHVPVTTIQGTIESQTG